MCDKYTQFLVNKKGYVRRIDNGKVLARDTVCVKVKMTQ